jgi:hypothetical protein
LRRRVGEGRHVSLLWPSEEGAHFLHR